MLGVEQSPPCNRQGDALLPIDLPLAKETEEVAG